MSPSRRPAQRAAEVGLVPGTVFGIVGSAYGHPGIRMPGRIVPATGLHERSRSAT